MSAVDPVAGWPRGSPVTIRDRSGLAGKGLIGRLALALAALAAIAPAGASAQVPAYREIASAGPLTNIYAGNTLACQVRYLGDQGLSFYSPSSIPGNCGTRLAVGGTTQGFLPVSQSAVVGNGSQADPFRVVTAVETSSGLQVVQTDTYVVGSDFYRSDVTVSNPGPAPVSGVLLHGADCYLQDSDSGFGFFDAATGGIYCTANPNNSPPARVEGFVPLSPGSRYFEGSYTAAFSPGPTGFPNTCLCLQRLDNGMALSWEIAVPVGGQVSRSFATTFSPTGRIFGQPPPDTTPPETSVTSGPPPLVRGNTATFSFNSSEPGSTFECSLDGGPFAPCGSPFTTPPLAPGSHTLAVRSRDAAGNVDQTPTVYTFRIAAALADLPAPELGREVNVQAVRGTVLVGVPAGRARSARAGASQKGLRFVPLEEARQIPVGSFLDTKRGTVRLVSATGTSNRTQRGDFNAGLFQILQSRNRKAKGLTELRLKGASFNSCRKPSRRRRGRATAAGRRKLSNRTIRSLRGNAKGNFRTRGRHSAATVRGTIWLTADRCDGTLTKVTRGRVAVRDLRRKRTITLTAGKSYLARATR
jgi:hypothetical protein